jgi:hypothetical protein
MSTLFSKNFLETAGSVEISVLFQHKKDFERAIIKL